MVKPFTFTIGIIIPLKINKVNIKIDQLLVESVNRFAKNVYYL